MKYNKLKCKHCRKRIYQQSGYFYHTDTNRMLCEPLHAEPEVIV